VSMPEVLDLCVQLDSLAQHAYHDMASACTDAEVAHVFELMAKDGHTHVRWWQDLRDAWDKGLIPDIVSDSESLVMSLRCMAEELPASLPASYDGLSTSRMLEAAAHIELCMLDPVFYELVELTDPGGARLRRGAYDRHVNRLVKAIEEGSDQGDLSQFMTRVLRRTWSDNITLSMHAMRDPLTGLYNRRGMIDHLRHWLSWAERYGRPVAVILIDVDDFKAINDAYGHATGDRALREVAHCLKRSARGSDIVVRYGGDEFAVIAPETEGAGLRDLMQRIVDASCEASVLADDGGAVPLCVSAGAAVTSSAPARAHGMGGTGVGASAAAGASVAAVAPTATAGRGVDRKAARTIDGLLAAADHSLYEAKQRGKNRAGDPVVYGGRSAQV
jgi:diguanylate cyclase (GGDEF)-like protein